jgi:hypothetical protein
MAANTNLPAGNLKTSTNQQKLDDLWWRVATGEGKALDRYDQYGKPNGKTSVEVEAQWAAANFARLSGQIAGLLEAVKQLAKVQGGSIDLEAVKQASKDGAAEAIAEGVKVDVTVNGVGSNG